MSARKVAWSWQPFKNSARSDALTGAHRPRTCDAQDAFFRRADARIRRTQCALTRRETRVTTLTFFV